MKIFFLLHPTQEELIYAVEGFKSEVHTVETQDGFILKMHRVKRKGGLKPSRAQPVFIMHGLAMSGADFMRRETEDALRKRLVKFVINL